MTFCFQVGVDWENPGEVVINVVDPETGFETGQDTSLECLLHPVYALATEEEAGSKAGQILGHYVFSQ